MEKEMDKKLDEFTGKLMKDLPSESPSFNFTTRIMSEVDALSKSRVSEYKPLITKKIWMVLALLSAGIFSLLFFGDVQFETSLKMPTMFNSLPSLNSLALPDYKISNIFLYAVVGFAIFAGIQIFMLKHHFNRRMAMP